MKNSKTTYQDRVNAIVDRDVISTDNFNALCDLTNERLLNAETPEDEERALSIDRNVANWLVKAALRRHRKVTAAARAPLNNALATADALAFRRIKVRAGK